MNARFGYFVSPHPGIYYSIRQKLLGIKLDPSNRKWTLVRPLSLLGQIDELIEIKVEDVNKFISAVLILIDTLSSYDIFKIPDLANIMLLILARFVDIDVVKLEIPQSYTIEQVKMIFPDVLEQTKITSGLNIYHAACHEIAGAVAHKSNNVLRSLRMIMSNGQNWLCPTWFNSSDNFVSLADNIWFYLLAPKHSGMEFDARFLKALGYNLPAYMWPEESTKMSTIYTRDILCIYAIRQLFTDACYDKLIYLLKTKLFDPSTGLFIRGQTWLGSVWSGIYGGVNYFGEPIMLHGRTVRMPPKCSGYYLLSCQDQLWAMLALDVISLEQIIAPFSGLDFWSSLRNCFGRFNDMKLCGLGYSNFVDNVISFDNTLAGIIAGKFLLDHYSSLKNPAELTELRRDVEQMEEYVLSQGVIKQSSRMAETGFGTIAYPLVNIGTTAWFTFYSFCYNPLRISL